MKKDTNDNQIITMAVAAIVKLIDNEVEPRMSRVRRVVETILNLDPQDLTQAMDEEIENGKEIVLMNIPILITVNDLIMLTGYDAIHHLQPVSVSRGVAIASYSKLAAEISRIVSSKAREVEAKYSKFVNETGLKIENLNKEHLN